jgi:hypothetical protein
MVKLVATLAFALASACIVGACIVGDRPAVDNLVCDAGECTCAPRFGDCDGQPDNGCESRLDADAAHCGACGNTCLNGACEVGVCACSEGHEDCNASPVDGCEAFLEVDADHCGACGHGCLGGTCGGSRCEPFLVGELGNYIYAFAVDDENAYFCDGDSGLLYRVPKEGGESTVLTVDQNCYELAAAGGLLYWTVREHNEELVRAIPIDGSGELKTLAVVSAVRSFVASGANVFFASEDLGTTSYEVWSASGSGQKRSLAQYNEPIRFVAVQDSDVFYGLEGALGTTIYRVAATGGASSQIATIERTLAGLAVAGDSVYWLEAAAEGEQPSIFRAPIGGGTPEELFRRNRQVDTLLADATGLYWTEDQGDRVLHAPLDGGDFEILTQYQDITLPKLSADALYWIDFPAHLFGLAK